MRSSSSRWRSTTPSPSPSSGTPPRDDLQDRQAAAQRAQDAVAPARWRHAGAGGPEKFQVQVDEVATEAMEAATSTSSTPRAEPTRRATSMDQMTTLESFTADQKAVLDKAKK